MFCQDCGQRIELPAAPARPSQAAAALDALLCPACGATNPAGMKFCKLCGTALAVRPSGAVLPVPAPAPAPSSGAKITCVTCGKVTPQGFAFCQHCGHKVIANGPHAEAALPPVDVSAAGGRVPAALAVTYSSPPPAAPAPTTAGRLIAIRRDGSDGEQVALGEDAFDIGRTDGSLTFPEDPFLAARHARFTPGPGGVRVRPLDRTNGVYVRVHGSADLHSGDSFLIGKEVLRFETVPAEEREPPGLVENGVRIFGTVPREAWGRVRQITTAGTTRDVWHLVRPDLVLGREEGDVTFSDDEYLSRRHAAVRRVTKGAAPARLEDLASSNGTFLRIRGELELKSGDVLRLGDQLVRFES